MNNNDGSQTSSKGLDPLFLFSFPNSQRLQSNENRSPETKFIPSTPPKSKRRNIKIYNFRTNRSRFPTETSKSKNKAISIENSETEFNPIQIEKEIKRKFAKKSKIKKLVAKTANMKIQISNQTKKVQLNSSFPDQTFFPRTKFFRKCRLCHNQLALQKKERISQRVLIAPSLRLVFQFLDVTSMREAKLANKFFYEVARRCEEDRDQHFYYSISKNRP